MGLVAFLAEFLEDSEPEAPRADDDNIHGRGRS
jgi:hypothetical protein